MLSYTDNEMFTKGQVLEVVILTLCLEFGLFALMRNWADKELADNPDSDHINVKLAKLTKLTVG